MAKVDVVNIKGDVVGSKDLDDTVFASEVNSGLIHQVYVGLKANTRHGTHSTKTRGEVRGGGKKPWSQKGTGNARQGTKTSPIWKGGGITFGPRPRKYTKVLPQKMRHGALRGMLSARASENMLRLIDDFSLDSFSTKSMVSFFEKQPKRDTGVTRSLVVVAGTGNDGEQKAAKSVANIPNVQVVPVGNLNVAHIVDSHCVFIVDGAADRIVEVLK